MSLNGIPAGTSVFVDANIFIYALADDAKLGAACTSFLERIEFDELTGFISSAVLSDVGHRLLTLEACATFGWPYVGIARRLRRHPDEVRKLVRFREAVREIVAVGFQVLPVTREHVLRSAEIVQQHGILSNDALIVAVMEAHNLVHIASNDSDFDRVPGIARHSPS